MRASAIESDPGYINKSKVIKVLLDDELVGRGRVVMADEEEGVIEIYKLDANGDRIFDRNSRCFITITLKGRVDIVTVLH